MVLSLLKTNFHLRVRNFRQVCEGLVDTNICRREPVLKYFWCFYYFPHNLHLARENWFISGKTRNEVVRNKICFTVTQIKNYKDCLPWIFMWEIRGDGIFRITLSIQGDSSGWTVLSKSFLEKKIKSINNIFFVANF